MSLPFLSQTVTVISIRGDFEPDIEHILTALISLLVTRRCQYLIVSKGRINDEK
jgi:hypothetical protein